MPDFQDILNQRRPFQPMVVPPLPGGGMKDIGILDGSSNQGLPTSLDPERGRLQQQPQQLQASQPQQPQGKFQDVLQRARPKKAPETPSQFEGMDPLQQRSVIATQALMGGEMDPELMKYYRRLMLTTMVGKKGQIFGDQNLLPIERQFLQQVYGARSERAMGGKGKFLSFLARKGHVRPKRSAVLEIPWLMDRAGEGRGSTGFGGDIGIGGYGGYGGDVTGDVTGPDERDF